MNTFGYLALAAALTGLSGAALSQTSLDRRFETGQAESRIDRSFDAASTDCADVNWSQRALEAFPSIASACQAVVERNGKTYVQLEGEVEEVRDQGKRIRVDFQDGERLTFTPTPRTSLYIDGRATPFEELNDGQELNFYIPEDRLQAELQPDPDRLAFVIVPLDIDVIPSREQGVARSEAEERRTEMTASTQGEFDELPRTAGPLPLIGLGGALLVLLGAGITIRRKLR